MTALTRRWSFMPLLLAVIALVAVAVGGRAAAQGPKTLVIAIGADRTDAS